MDNIAKIGSLVDVSVYPSALKEEIRFPFAVVIGYDTTRYKNRRLYEVCVFGSSRISFYCKENFEVLSTLIMTAVSGLFYLS